MPEEKPDPFYRIVIAACGFLFAAFWIVIVVREFGVVQARRDLLEAIEQGNAVEVIALLDRIDPEGTGTAEGWTGEGALKSQSGFPWLLSQWGVGNHGHPEGIVTLYQQWAKIDPFFPRRELFEHIRGQTHRETLEGLFEFALALDYSGGREEDKEDLRQLFSLAQRDPGLALLAWKATIDGRAEMELPEDVFKAAVRPSNFAQVKDLDLLLQLTGLLDPVATFSVREGPRDSSRNSVSTWIERIHGPLVGDGGPDYKAARELIEREYLANVTPASPGLFLLHRLIQDSTNSAQVEFSPAAIEPALSNFDQLRPEAKAGVAKLLDRYIPDYGKHEALRTWVWEHHRLAWEEQRDRYLVLTGAEIKETWRSGGLYEWLRTAAKHDHATGSTAAVLHLHRLQVADMAKQGLSHRDNAYEDHPFCLTMASSQGQRSKEGSAPLPGQFALLLAFSRDPSTPPCQWFPDLNQMGYTKASIPFQRSPWFNASAEEFNEALTLLGEPFTEDPLRFLIVPFFHELANNFSETLQKPDELAEFQKLAAENDRPGGWLAKDLADLLPRWWMDSKEKHAALLSAGGRSYSYERMNTYIQDRRTPVAARVSYALGLFDWHASASFRDRADRIGAPLPRFPELDELALEFAREFEGGKWIPETLPQAMWDLMLPGWLYEPLIPDHSERAANRKSARQAILSRLEPIVLDALALTPDASAEPGKSTPDPNVPLMKTYATLLRLEENEDALSRLWKEAERCLKRPQAIFAGLPNSRSDRTQVLAGASADVIIRRFREKGWEGVREYVAKMEGPAAYTALSEASAHLNFREWVAFCSGVLDLSKASEAPGRDHFCAFPPASFLNTARGLNEELKPNLFLAELAGVEIRPDQAGFFSLALPPVFRQVLGRGETAIALVRTLGAERDRPVSPSILREIVCAANSRGDSHEPRHLDALRNPEIPLAQRWVAAAYFQLVRSEDSRQFARRLEEWKLADRALAEAAADLLVEAIDRKLPVWPLAARELGRLNFRPTHLNTTIANFSLLYSLDKSGEQQRARALMDRKRIEAMLADHPERTLLLNAVYSLAIQADDRFLAADIFTEAESRLTFEEKLRWLFLGKFRAPMARLFAREWHRIGELTLGFSSFAQGEDLKAILDALPDDPDLRRLVQATLQQHSMSTRLINRGLVQVTAPDLKLVQDFIKDKFASPGMEALCLARLPVRMEHSPPLAIWLDHRLKGQDWSTMLTRDSDSIRREWPYWSRRIEVLAGAGDFETLSRLLPEAKWFANRPRPFDDGYSTPATDSIEEMVWMSFARPLAHQLRFGSQEHHLDAGAIAARLLQSPPASKGLDEVRQPFAIPSYRPWTFHSDAVHELWLHATAATLVATLEETPEVSLARCDKYELPKIRSVINDSLIIGSSHQDFFRLLAEHGETLSEVRRKELFLRALESKPFTRATIPRILPCHSLARLQLPREISLDYVVKLAEARLNAQPNHAFRLADLGLVHSRAGNVTAALPLLERSMTLLDASKEEDQSVLDQVEPALSQFRRPSANGRAPSIH